MSIPVVPTGPIEFFANPSHACASGACGAVESAYLNKEVMTKGPGFRVLPLQPRTERVAVAIISLYPADPYNRCVPRNLLRNNVASGQLAR